MCVFMYVYQMYSSMKYQNLCYFRHENIQPFSHFFKILIKEIKSSINISF